MAPLKSPRQSVDADAAAGARALAGTGADVSRATDVSRESWMANLLVAHFPRLWRVARRMGLEPMRAEEAAQEAFVILFEKRAVVAPGKELAFLISAVTHVTQNMRRKVSYAYERPVSPELMDIHPAVDNVQRLVEQLEAKELVDELIANLSEPLRVVLILFELEGLTLQQIADALDIPLGTAGSRLRLARKAFQRAVAQRKNSEGPFEEEL